MSWDAACVPCCTALPLPRRQGTAELTPDPFPHIRIIGRGSGKSPFRATFTRLSDSALSLVLRRQTALLILEGLLARARPTVDIAWVSKGWRMLTCFVVTGRPRGSRGFLSRRRRVEIRQRGESEEHARSN